MVFFSLSLSLSLSPKLIIFDNALLRPLCGFFVVTHRGAATGAMSSRSATPQRAATTASGATEAPVCVCVCLFIYNKTTATSVPVNLRFHLNC